MQRAPPTDIDCVLLHVLCVHSWTVRKTGISVVTKFQKHHQPTSTDCVRRACVYQVILSCHGLHNWGGEEDDHFQHCIVYCHTT